MFNQDKAEATDILREESNKETRGLWIAIIISGLVFIGLNVGFWVKAFKISDLITGITCSIALILLVSVVLFYRLKWHFLSFLTVFSLIFLLVRLPFYLMFFYGEDGIFTNIYLNNTQPPLLWLIGQIEGVKYYTLIHHPTFSFKYMSEIGHLAKFVLDFDSMSDIELSFFVRWMHSMSFFAAWMILLCVLYQKFPERILRIRSVFMIILIANLPMAIYLSAYEIHMDQSFGVISSAVLIWAIYRFDGSIFSGIFATIASILFNLGKNEWSFCFLIALGIIGLYSFVIKLENPKATRVLIISLFLGL
ncbi:MAG: hypothetical protein K2Q22_09250, partial [Cytophagales bacterium]|nr:hypothetical protein [Cytophagales bacterium]